MMSFNNQVQKVQWNLVYRNLILLGILVAVYAYRAGSLAFDQLIAGGIPNPWITYAMLSVWILFFVVVLGVHWYTRTRAKKNEAERAAAAAQRSGSTPAASPQ